MWSLQARARAVAAAAVAVAVLAPGAAFAVSDNDIVLEGLVIRCGTERDLMDTLPCFDPMVMASPTAQDPLAKFRYRLLGYQLGVALAPRFLAPAETLGYNGFQVSIETSFTTFNRSEDYWTMGTERHSPGTFGGSGDRGVMHLTSLMVRKGLPWSLEIAAGGSYLSNSEIATGNVHVKWAVLGEGTYDLFGGVGRFLPDVAVRGGLSRAIGTGEMDLTIASLDISASKAFGIGGMWNLTPYVGWSLLWIFVRSEVIDFTPEVVSGKVGADGRFALTAGEARRNDVFQDEDLIRPNRIFAGFRIVYTKFSFVTEFAFTPGLSVLAENIALQNGTQEDIRLTADAQYTFSFAIAADF